MSLYEFRCSARTTVSAYICQQFQLFDAGFDFFYKPVPGKQQKIVNS